MRTAVHFVANCYFCLYTDISIFNIFMYVCTHTHREMHIFIHLQIDTDNWLGERAFPFLHSLSVSTGADTPGEQLAKL